MKCLVTAIGSLSAPAVLESLRTLPATRIVGTNSLPAAWTATADMVDRYFEVAPASEPLAFLRDLLGVCQAEGIDRVVPLTDPEVDVLTEHSEHLREAGIVLCAPSRESARICRDKWLAYRAFEGDERVRRIPTWRLEEFREGDGSPPLLVKPRTGRSSEGVFCIDDAWDLGHYRRKLRGRGYIIQPRLPGSVCVVDIVRQRSTERSVAISRVELTRTSNGAGLSVRMPGNTEAEEAASHIARILDINGCINIEFLLHSDEPLLMDINPRFSAGTAFSKLAGYDMVVNHLRCFSSTPIEASVTPTHSVYTRRYVERRSVHGETPR